MKNKNLPIFPLGIVALPGTIQNLQIFEPRYINMVKKCMENDHGFVIAFQKKLTKRGLYKKSTVLAVFGVEPEVIFIISSIVCRYGLPRRFNESGPLEKPQKRHLKVQTFV